MPSLSLAVTHALGQAQAIERLKSRFSEIRQQFGDRVSDLEEVWEGELLRFRFKAMGMKIQGTVTPGPEDVKVDASLPLAALPFKRTIEDQIRGDLARALA